MEGTRRWQGGSRARWLGMVQGSRRGGPSPAGGCMDRAWASWRTNECVCEPVPCTKADPCLSTLPSWPVVDTCVTSCGPRGRGLCAPHPPPLPLAACVCLTAFGLQATTKEVKDSLGKQWSQLSDKKRLKWIHKALEQRKEYEVRLPLRSSPSGSSRASAL